MLCCLHVFNTHCTTHTVNVFWWHSPLMGALNTGSVYKCQNFCHIGCVAAGGGCNQGCHNCFLHLKISSPWKTIARGNFCLCGGCHVRISAATKGVTSVLFLWNKYPPLKFMLAAATTSICFLLMNPPPVRKYPREKIPRAEIYATGSGHHHQHVTCFFLHNPPPHKNSLLLCVCCWCAIFGQ